MFPVHKNKTYKIEVHDIGRNGEGVGKVGNFIIYVKGAVPGDIIEAKILKLKKKYGFAKIQKIIIPSPERTEAKCPVAKECGGCQLQEIKYKKQLKIKDEKIIQNIKKISGINIKPDNIKGMKNPYSYRNKGQFAFGVKNNKVVLGLYATGSHNVIESDICYIQNTLINKVLEANKKYFKNYESEIYREHNHTGTLRHLLIRASENKKEILVTLIINSNTWKGTDSWVKEMKKIKEVVSINLNINTEKGDTIIGDKTINISGKETIKETIGRKTYRLSPTAFFQINPIQTQNLYESIKQNIDPKETCIWDIYCGSGTIGIYIAEKVKKVIGIESNKAAIADAKKNISYNKTTNVTCLHGKAEEIMTDNFLKKLDKPSTVIIDPPRKGCDPIVINKITKQTPKKILYVSCDTATFARDTKRLQTLGYKLNKLESFDMFPQTNHVELLGIFTKEELFTV